jgi:glucose/arabinose dehydrogenase
VTFEETLLDEWYGRLRAVVIGPDGALYVSTANGPGDRILRITR